MTEITFIEPLSAATGVARATTLFRSTFSEEPSGVWQAPGRVNIIGEHTDYNAGLCLPIALPHNTFIALKAREDTLVHLVSDVNPQDVVEVDLNGLAARGVTGWAAYPVGVAWALREAGFSVRGFDAAFVSCVPLGSGLSSSAAMTCSTALALDGEYELGFGSSDEGRITLINAAIRAENEMAGASTGGLDQSASMRCTAGHAIRLDCMPGLSALESVTQEPFDLTQHGLELLVLDTCAPHQLNDGQYAQRRATCEAAAQKLGYEHLRALADEIAANDNREQGLADTLGRLDDEVMVKRVRHVITEIWRVDEFVEAFGAGDMTRSGQLLNASHDSLRDDYEVTVAELDVAVDVARASGALGARMTGGGFGGSIIALVEQGKAQPIAQAIADEFERRGFNAPRALPAVAAASAQRAA